MSNNLSSVAEDLIFFGQEVLSQLQHTLKLVPTVRRSYKGAEEAPGAIVQIPYIDVEGGASDRAIGDAVNTSNVSSGFTQVTLGQLYQAAAIDNLQRTFQNVDLMTETASRIAYNVAAGADAKVAALWNYIPNEVGETDGTAMFNSTDDINVLAAARKVLSDNDAPLDFSKMHCVLNPQEAYDIRTLDSYKRANWAGTAQGRKTGDLDDTMGFQLHESQQIASATLTTSTLWGTPLTNGAGNKGDSTLSVKGLQSTAAMKKGSSFALAGKNYVITTNVTASSGNAVLAIHPKLAADVAGDVALTPVSHSAAGSMNFIYHSDAILFVARPAAAFVAGSGITSVVARDPQTGLGIRISYQGTLVGASGMTEALVADIVCGAAVPRPEWAIKATGKI